MGIEMELVYNITKGLGLLLVLGVFLFGLHEVIMAVRGYIGMDGFFEEIPPPDEDDLDDGFNDDFNKKIGK